MKAKRRHELQENVLSAELTEIVQFFKERGSTLILIVLVTLIVIFGVYYFYSSSAEKSAEAQRKLTMVLTEIGQDMLQKERLLMGLSGGPDKRVAARATVALGDLYSLELGMKESSNTLDRQHLMDSARSKYESVLRTFSEQKEAVALAYMGLGSLAETSKQFDIARSQYEAAKAVSGIEGYPVYDQAVEAMGELDELSKPVRMAASAPVEPAQQTATQPTGQSDSSSIFPPVEFKLE